MPDRQPEDNDRSGDSSPEALETPAAVLRGAWLRLPLVARGCVVGTMGAACMAAVLLWPAEPQRVAPGKEAAFLHRSPGGSPDVDVLPRPIEARMLQLVDWDESRGVLARSADGLPGMPPASLSRGSPFAGQIGDWNGGPPNQPQPTSIHDVATPGRRCRRNEELFLGVCYKNCTLLTGGLYSIRFAPNGCCKNYPCLTPSEVDFQGFAPGTGYMVSADGDGSYPHAPGECDGNEESHLGMCYKKCALLTNNVYTHRVAANTCCKQSPCWNPFNLDTKGGTCSGYSVGGGNSRDTQCPHQPTS
mmetsp:Transcript_42615/g.127365  ORF Transcript_42615/g.127365 Transcript_42615/m.127365 type:complete len:303 (+) Transcript_42615:89-997(+)